MTTDESTIPILRRLALRQAKQRLLCALLRRPSLWPNVEPSGIGCCHFANNPKWQEAFDMVRNGADIPSLIALNPTCETARLWGLGIEMDADKMLSLARQIVASVRAEEAADEVAETAPKSSTVVEPENDHRAKAEVVDVSANRRSTTKPVSVTAADVVTAKVDAVLPDAQRRGITTKEPKLVPPTPARSRTPAGKLAEAMSFLRDELQAEQDSDLSRGWGQDGAFGKGWSRRRSLIGGGRQGEGGSPCPAGSSLSAHLPAARPRRLASLSGVTVPPGYTTARARALDREAAASGRPIASGGNGHAYRVLPRAEMDTPTASGCE